MTFVYSKFEKIANGANLLMAKWSPIGDKLAYVFENDIYYITFDPHRTHNVTRRLTTTGKLGVIYNGVPDWMYHSNILIYLDKV